MHPKSNAPTLAGQPSTDLVLERLPNGTYAWLKPERHRAFIPPARYWLTDKGRRAIALDACFGPRPTVAEVSAS